MSDVNWLSMSIELDIFINYAYYYRSLGFILNLFFMDAGIWKALSKLSVSMKNIKYRDPIGIYSVITLFKFFQLSSGTDKERSEETTKKDRS